MTIAFDITFTIVSYNSSKSLRGAIESCIAAIESCYPTKGKVVVYDNASNDSCPEILDDFTNRYPQIFIGIKGKENLGFAKGNNQAIALAPSKVYVLVNPDVTFKPSTITKLHSTLNSAKDIAIVCPKLLYLDRTVQPSVRRFPTFTYLFLKILLGEKLQSRLYPFNYYYDDNRPTSQTVMEVDWGIGAFMMISGDYVAKYGLFDERFFLYFEDVSLCRDVWKNQHRVLFQADVSALHIYHRSSTCAGFNRLTSIHIISALKFFAKYGTHRRGWQFVMWLLQINSKSQFQVPKPVEVTRF